MNLEEAKKELAESFSKNETRYVELVPERDPKQQAWKVSGVKERGITVNILGHEWFFEWCEITAIY